MGERVIINEYCNLDGREGIIIRDDTSISVFSYIDIGQHLVNSSDFEYSTQKVLIADHVWICTKANGLGEVNLLWGCIICVGSTVKKGIYDRLGIYSGVPSIKIGERKEHVIEYNLSVWKPFFGC